MLNEKVLSSVSVFCHSTESVAWYVRDLCKTEQAAQCAVQHSIHVLFNIHEFSKTVAPFHMGYVTNAWIALEH